MSSDMLRMIVFPVAIMTVVLYIVRFLPLNGQRRKRLRTKAIRHCGVTP